MRALTADEIEDVSGGIKMITLSVGIGLFTNLVYDGLKAGWESRASIGGGSEYDEWASRGISA